MNDNTLMVAFLIAVGVTTYMWFSMLGMARDCTSICVNTGRHMASLVSAMDDLIQKVNRHPSIEAASRLEDISEIVWRIASEKTDKDGCHVIRPEQMAKLADLCDD